jgi:molecular chaperone GrpE (heat shock protein)
MGEPVPVLTEADRQTLGHLSQQLTSLTRLMETLPLNPQPRPEPVRSENGQTEAQTGEPPQSQGNADDLAEQVRKLARTQFKTNSLQESQLAQQQTALESLQKSLTQQEKLLAELNKQQAQAVEAAQLELLKSMLPVLDSLDAAFNNGRRQVLRLPLDGEVRHAVIAWLDGIRLARMRLLDLLAAYDIRPIPTVGQSFTPHYHIAVATDMTGRAPEGTIVSEDRPGYASPAKVLREAEVVVARSK